MIFHCYVSSPEGSSKGPSKLSWSVSLLTIKISIFAVIGHNRTYITNEESDLTNNKCDFTNANGGLSWLNHEIGGLDCLVRNQDRKDKSY